MIIDRLQSTFTNNLRSDIICEKPQLILHKHFSSYFTIKSICLYYSRPQQKFNFCEEMAQKKNKEEMVDVQRRIRGKNFLNLEKDFLCE